MCGRYAIYSKKLIKEKFNIEIKINYNVCPGESVLVIDHHHTPRKMIWSFSPIWANSEFNIINARSETLHEKASFKDSYRCIFIADGYYEWKKDKDYKKPFYHFQKSSIMYMAGIFNKTSGCCIITKKSK